MSSKSIKSFESYASSVGRPVPRPVDISGVYRRESKTDPPPSVGATCAGLEARERELRTLAQGLLAQANDLARIIASMKGE